MRRRGAALAVTLLLAGCSPSTEGLHGAELYEQVCAACHRSDGSGNAGPAIGPGSGSVGLSDEQLAGVITVGPGAMPAFSRLTDEQVESLVAHIRTLQSP